jgi:hypothetical protein
MQDGADTQSAPQGGTPTCTAAVEEIPLQAGSSHRCHRLLCAADHRASTGDLGGWAELAELAELAGLAELVELVELASHHHRLSGP